jgi:hypothetical protein
VAGNVLLIYGTYGEARGKREGAAVMWDEQHGWRNVPDEVWSFPVNGHVAWPKWLSYRKNTPRHHHQLSANEREQFMYLARRVVAIIHLQSDCDTAWTAAVEAPLQS